MGNWPVHRCCVSGRLITMVSPTLIDINSDSSLISKHFWHTSMHTAKINPNMRHHTHVNPVKEQERAGEGGRAREKRKKTRLMPHKCLFVWASASSPKLDDSVFDGTRCTTIKETEELTAGQIRALNLSICLGAARRAGRESRLSERAAEIMEARFQRGGQAARLRGEDKGGARQQSSRERGAASAREEERESK